MSDIFYYSNYCNHSQKVLEYICKNNLISKLSCICIDNRARDHQNNNIIILLENGSKVYLPPTVQSVPTLLVKSRNHTTIHGYKNVIGFLSSESEYSNVQETNSKILQKNFEPISFGSLNSSNNFMEYDLKNPIQDMSNLVSVNSLNSINAPDENYKPDKLSSDVTVDKLVAQRNSINIEYTPL
jgi:hypothetical protein